MCRVMEAKGKKYQEKDKKITFNPSLKLRDKKFVNGYTI